MRKLLITGAAGYLGRELVRRSPGPVRATYFSQPVDLPAEWVQADVRELDPSLLDGVDAVIHTAYRQGEDEWSTNVDGSATVARAARGLRLVHLSTDLVFDGQCGRYREDDPIAPVGSYGESKAEAERLVAALHGSPLIVRTSLLYGGSVPGPQERLAREGTRFYVDEMRSPVHAGDLADALLELVALDVTGPLHVAGADDVSRYDFAKLLGAGEVETANTPPGRAPDVTLDSSRAQSLLRTRLRGVYETLSNDPKRSSCT
ncbi:MAG TPA: sugar nucleotide-binding protein [Gaiellaceae bacterium]|nr:sugar nucleotide-binding protein [Gaiellaceae bacterium]